MDKISPWLVHSQWNIGSMDDRSRRTDAEKHGPGVLGINIVCLTQ